MTPDELRDLKERSSLIQELTKHPGWEIYCDRAKATMLQKQRRLVQGLCSSYEDYKQECAFTDGLEFMLRLPERVNAELQQALDQEQAAREARLGA
jgi:hypothetical protein